MLHVSSSIFPVPPPNYFQHLPCWSFWNQHQHYEHPSIKGYFSSVQLLSCVRPFVTPWTAATPRVHPNPCPLSQWYHPTISSSVTPFSCCLQSFPASGSFPMSQLFSWGGQSPGVLPLASFPPKKSQDWSPLGWTGWISLQSKGLSRVFSNTTVQKHHAYCFIKKKWYKWTYLKNRKRLTDLEDKLMLTGWKDWEEG